jgi:hypothetical protein
MNNQHHDVDVQWLALNGHVINHYDSDEDPIILDVG